MSVTLRVTVGDIKKAIESGNFNDDDILQVYTTHSFGTIDIIDKEHKKEPVTLKKEYIDFNFVYD